SWWVQFLSIFVCVFVKHKLVRLEHIANDFYREYRLDKDAIIDRVYNKPHANVFLAGFMKFIVKRKNDPFMREMLAAGIRDFIGTHVCCFPQHQAVPVHFIGSISHYLEDIVREEAATFGITIGHIVKQPIDGLVQYHLHQKIPEYLSEIQ
ncbi:MAG: hypothetical protein AAGB22_09130, partial [Bacteroidota bacterium]